MADSNDSAHRPLASRTTDPEAASYDEASQLVQTGLQHARSGSIDVGLPLIACAFLLDTRAIEFKPVLEQNQDDPLKYLDMDLLQQLIDYDGGNNVASQVLMIYAAILFGQAEGARSRTLQALRVSSNIITDITNDPTMEDPSRGILGGCLKRVILYRMRATLYLSLELPNAAVEELSEALHLNPNLTSIGCERAVLCAIMSYKSDRDLVHDFRRVARHAHPDARELRETYAWLAKLIVGNRELGSYEQAQRYLQLNRSSKARQEEIYGPTTSLLIESEMEAAMKAYETSMARRRESRAEQVLPTSSPKHFTFLEFTNTIEEDEDERDASETSQRGRTISSFTVSSRDEDSRTPISRGVSAMELIKTIRQIAIPSQDKIISPSYLDSSSKTNVTTPSGDNIRSPTYVDSPSTTKTVTPSDDKIRSPTFLDSSKTKMAAHPENKSMSPPYLDSPSKTKIETPTNDKIRSQTYLDSPPKAKIATPSDDKIRSPSYSNSPPKSRTPMNRRGLIACTACGSSATRELPLSMCSRCCGAFYCSKECQRSKAWVQHRLLCKVTAGDQTNNDSQPLTASPTKRLANVVSSPKQGNSTGRLLPRKPLDEEMQVWELANKRMRLYVTKRFRDHGRDFAGWWHAMPDTGKKDTLKQITNSTFPAKSRSNVRMVPVLKTGDPKYSACVLKEWCFERTLSKCKCEKHWHKDALLHEMFYHLEEDRAEDIEYQLCVSMVMQGYIPSSNDDEPRLLRLPNESDPVQAHQFLHRKACFAFYLRLSTKESAVCPSTFPLKGSEAVSIVEGVARMMTVYNAKAVKKHGGAVKGVTRCPPTRKSAR
ncbi:hypothetical protein MHU86_1917 [Fragilaria crotonensis]|nr:hypothetical protein MHU86_1917 [Fragilaria crotonensis]